MFAHRAGAAAKQHGGGAGLMPISPDTAEKLAAAVRDIYVNAETRLLAVLTRRLAAGIDGPGWAGAKLAEVAAFRREVQAELAALTASTKAEIESAVLAAYTTGSDAAVADMRAVLSRTFGAFRKNPALQALVTEAVTQVRSTHLRILRMTTDAYRAAVADATGVAVVGAETRIQATQRALDTLARTGITGFVDSAGRNWDLASYTEMATRTALGRAQVQGHIDRLQDNDRDLVIVSGHSGSCPVCAPWEGRVLSISGKASGYPPLADARAAGLQHVNCRHSVGLYLPGVTKPMRTQPESDRAAEYADRQEQRYMERQVRAWKRRETTSLTDQARLDSKRKVSEWQARLRQHTTSTGLPRKPVREQIARAR